jgi:hypothetical protein
MASRLTARCDPGGRWTLERGGTPVVGTPGVPEDELLVRIEGMVVAGTLDETQRIVIVDLEHGATIRRVDQLLGMLRERGLSHERDLGTVRAERYRSGEQYV